MKYMKFCLLAAFVIAGAELGSIGFSDLRATYSLYEYVQMRPRDSVPAEFWGKTSPSGKRGSSRKGSAAGASDLCGAAWV